MSTDAPAPDPAAQPSSSSWWSKLGYESIPPTKVKQDFYELKVDLPGGRVLDMADLKGKPVLIVNTASKCGFTPQYTALQKLHDDYKDRGLVVLGFPCDQFGHQEPGSDDDIASFCQRNHGVDFTLAKKSDVNGPQMNETYAFLKSQEKGKGVLGTSVVKWNFEKILVSKDGQVLSRYSSFTKPETLKVDIENALKA